MLMISSAEIFQNCICENLSRSRCKSSCICTIHAVPLVSSDKEEATSFDEALARLSPSTVFRGSSLRSIDMSRFWSPVSSIQPQSASSYPFMLRPEPAVVRADMTFSACCLTPIFTLRVCALRGRCTLRLLRLCAGALLGRF